MSSLNPPPDLSLRTHPYVRGRAFPPPECTHAQCGLRCHPWFFFGWLFSRSNRIVPLLLILVLRGRSVSDGGTTSGFNALFVFFWSKPDEFHFSIGFFLIDHMISWTLTGALLPLLMVDKKSRPSRRLSHSLRIDPKCRTWRAHGNSPRAHTPDVWRYDCSGS